MTYVAVEVGEEVFIVAQGLLEKVGQRIGWPVAVTLTELDPRFLEGKKCRHPLYDRESLMILAPYVTLEDGTGVVHTAPGHGQEDYESGLRYHLDIYSPVDDAGRFTPEVGFFAGQFVFEANDTIKEKLRAVEALKGEETIEHSYPHCWRCKKPVIFRATEQWFISMEKNGLRQKALEEIDRVTWTPAWGRDRIRGMMETRPGLVPFPAAILGGPHPGLLLPGLRPVADHPGNPIPSGGSGFPSGHRCLVFPPGGGFAPGRHVLPSLPGARPSGKRPTSWMSGLIPG